MRDPSGEMAGLATASISMKVSLSSSRGACAESVNVAAKTGTRKRARRIAILMAASARSVAATTDRRQCSTILAPAERRRDAGEARAVRVADDVCEQYEAEGHLVGELHGI